MTTSEPGGARAADTERLAEAEGWWAYWETNGQGDNDERRAARTLRAEYDRRGAVEKAAAEYLMAGLCGDFEIPDGGAAHREKLTALIAAVRTNGEFHG